MKRIKLITILLLAFMALFIISCNNNDDTNKQQPVEGPIKVNQGYIDYISEYTSGIISKNSEIKFILNTPVDYPYTVGEKLPSDLFDISPSIDGDLILEDKYTLVFRPKTLFESATIYKGSLNLKKLLKAKKEFASFPFQVQTLKLNAKLDFLQYKAYTVTDLSKNFIEGIISSTDYIAEADFLKTISAKQNDRQLPIKFIRKSNTKVTIIIDSIIRKDIETLAILEFNGQAVGIDNKDIYNINIQALNNFKVLNVRLRNKSNSTIEVLFSSPISEKQDINGLITITDSKNNNITYTYTINGSLIRLHPGSMKNFCTVGVHLGLEDITGKKIKKVFYETIKFEDIIPEFKLVGKGNIMPNSESLIFPFEAVGLKEVKVTIVKVFKNNMGQFLQQNQLSSSSSLQKVGRPIYNSIVPLNLKDEDQYLVRKRYFIDINKLIDVKKGEIYNVELSFGKRNTILDCNEDDKDELVKIEENEDYWNGDSYYNGNYNYVYDYSERNNPCHPYFYNYHNTSISKNLISSNYGIISKQNEDGTYHVIVTDLRTTLPISHAMVELYNYQNQIILSKETNKEGFATFQTKKKGFYIKVSKDENIGYLRLKNENTLSYSMFDISGKSSPKGVKGFIYGERGVWRPGDSIHIFFVIEDKQHKLPNEYPVTFELFKPDNQLVKKEIVKKGLNGFYRFTALTSPDAVTGNWNIYAKVGGQEFRKRLKIEMVKPNRLKVELRSKNETLETGIDNTMNLSSKWLTGANAGALKTTVKVKLIPLKTSFDGYSQYIFDDPTKSFRSEEEEIFNGKLNAKGKQSFTYKTESNNEVPGMLKARFTSYVYEKGGDYSLNTQDYLLSNYNTYAGMNLNFDDDKYNLIYTDRNHTLNLISLDANGEKVNTTLLVKIFKLKWSWWWSSSDDNIANYIKNTDYIVRESDHITTVNGKASYSFSIPNKDWGRYYIQITDTKSGHITGQEIYIDWPNWSSRGNSNPDAATMLTFSTEKPKYKVGEDVKLIIPTAADGRALISLEKGGKVLRMFWAETKKGVSEVVFTATSDMSPNIYANITYIQKHSQTSNDLPIRMYGTTPVYIEDPTTHLFPQIEAPNSIESEENYSISVSEKNGKPMTYSLAIVDEGLLDITNYKTPSLWDFFYQREALRTKTWDMYDYVMGAFGTRLEKMFAIGGDSEAIKKNEQKANRFVPVVKVLGPFSLEGGETKVHKLKMSNYIGSVRAMVVAGNNGAYGKTEKAIPVKKPVMVLATLPRVLGTNETCDLPITVFVMDKAVKNVKVTVATNKQLEIIGAKSLSLKFNENKEQIVFFKLKTNSNTGLAKVKVSVEGNGSKAYHEIELDVRNPNPPVSESSQYLLEKNLEFRISPLGIIGSNEMKIEISALPSMAIDERLYYLISYPHGCLEQTTSSILPQLYLGALTNLSHERTIETEKNIKAGISRLYKFQLEDGGMSYWIGGRYSNEWGTSYAGHFMFEAEKMGYSLPSTFKDKWVKYQTSKANSWNTNTPNGMVQAYRLYTLALSGHAAIGAMNRLKELPLRIEAREMLASAYAAIGQTEVARQLVQNKTEAYVQASRLYYHYSYGSKQRDEAVRLMTYIAINDQAQAMNTLKKIAKTLSSDSYMNTQTTAFSLMAVSKYISVFKPSTTIAVDYKINGESAKIDSQVPVYTIILKNADSKQSLEFENNEAGNLFISVIRRGIPSAKEETEFSENLSIKVRYTDVNGSALKVDSLKQGTEFKAIVYVKNTNNIDEINDVALSQIFPSGWEIVNNRLLGTVNKNADQADFIDIRDDRVYQYFDLKASQSKTFKVSLISAYTGSYYLPGVIAEAMYDHNFKAGIKGKSVSVIK